LDVTGQTLTLDNDQISGDAIDGGTITNFASTGIDDDASSTAITIDGSGNLLVGTPTQFIGVGDNAHALFASGQTRHASNVGSTSFVMNVYGSGGNARVMGDGDLENSNGNYGTISDPRLKQDVTPASSQWDDVRDLGQQFVNYRLIESVEKQGDDAPTLLSVLADDDFATRFPGLTKTGDDGYRSFKQSVASMKGLVALSEALSRIETLEDRIAKLEAKMRV
jgi:hypothetical protein